MKVMVQVMMPSEVDILYGKGWRAFCAGDRCEVKMKGGRKADRG